MLRRFPVPAPSPGSLPSGTLRKAIMTRRHAQRHEPPEGMACYPTPVAKRLGVGGLD